MTQALSEFKRAALINVLRGCRLFAGLTGTDLQAVAAITSARSLEKGQFLFREHEPAQGFYVVQKGAINVHRVSPAGKEQVIRIFRAGESFAEATLATAAGYPADAVAVESSQVLLVEKGGFLALLARQPELAAFRLPPRLRPLPHPHRDRLQLVPVPLRHTALQSLIPLQKFVVRVACMLAHPA